MAVQSASVAKVAKQLRGIQDCLTTMLKDKEETMSNEESRDNPNQDRLDRYNEQMSVLEEAIRAVEEAADTLEGYE